MYADQFRAGGPALRNIADSIEAGTLDHSFWAARALAAIDVALRYGAPDVEAAG